jgi:hypothetical protein
VLEYPVHMAAAHGDIGAEFFGRAYDGAGGSFYAEDYLVIEVALYPEKGPRMKLAAGDFRLRLNGATREWMAVTPGTVAMAIRQPGMDRTRPGVSMGGGVGPGVVVMGGPRTVERFPGDPRTRVPSRPGTGQEEKPSDLEKGAKAAQELAVESVEADGLGASGLIYFYWRGKMRDLKRIDLIYDGPAGRATVRLR